MSGGAFGKFSKARHRSEARSFRKQREIAEQTLHRFHGYLSALIARDPRGALTLTKAEAAALPAEIVVIRNPSSGEVTLQCKKTELSSNTLPK